MTHLVPIYFNCSVICLLRGYYGFVKYWDLWSQGPCVVVRLVYGGRNCSGGSVLVWDCVIAVYVDMGLCPCGFVDTGPRRHIHCCRVRSEHVDLTVDWTWSFGWVYDFNCCNLHIADFSAALHTLMWHLTGFTTCSLTRLLTEHATYSWTVSMCLGRALILISIDSIN